MNIIFNKNYRERFKNHGFTLLEVMIAVVIFSFLMLYVAQLMHMEIRLYNSARKQNDLEHNTRSAMMHIIDELRLHHSKEIKITGSPPEDNVRVFGETTNKFCLICTDQSGIDSGGIYSFSDSDSIYPIIIYFDKSKNELWYQKNNQKQLISDQITSIKISNTGLLNIELVAEDLSINKKFNLVSSIRLL